MKKGILIAIPGTSSGDGARTLAGIDELFRTRFPGTRIAWAYTSSGVRRKLEQAGRPAADPREALAGLKDEGTTHVAVKSLHFARGMEYSELRVVALDAQAEQGWFDRIVVSDPLMDTPADFDRTVRRLLSDLPAGTEPEDAILLVAHGSRRPEAQASYAKAAAVCGRLDRRVILSTLLMDSGFEDVVRECKAANLRKVVMAPLMIVAGTSARNDLAGSGPGSLVSVLNREGIRCVPVIKGLGDNSGIVSIWVEDVERMLAEPFVSSQRSG